MQAAIARLATDAAAREALRADPAAFATRCGLDAEESRWLAGEMSGELEDFARSLRQKRLHEALRSMPLAEELLGERCAALFREYADATPLGPARNPALDALDFHHWLLTRATLTTPQRDAIQYEAAWITMQHTPRRFLVRFLLVPEAGSASRSVVIWWRRRGKIRHWVSP